MTQKIVYVDASLLAKSSCRLRVYYQQQGFTSKVNNNDVEWGTAFHIFKAEFRRGGDMAFLIGCNKAKKYYRETPMNIVYKKRYLNEAFLIKVCADYAAQYEKDLFEPIIHEGEPLTELKFCVPYVVLPDMVLMLVGTMDEIGKWLNGPYTISDTKTTSFWNTENYFAGYELSPQLMFYLFILKLYAENFPNSIFAKIYNANCGAFIDGVFYSSSAATEFKRSKVLFFSEETMAEYKILLDEKIAEIIKVVRNSEKPFREGMINGSCSGNFKCPFLGACSMPDDVSREAILKNNFAVKPYNPLLFQTESSRVIT